MAYFIFLPSVLFMVWAIWKMHKQRQEDRVVFRLLDVRRRAYSALLESAMLEQEEETTRASHLDRICRWASWVLREYESEGARLKLSGERKPLWQTRSDRATEQARRFNEDVAQTDGELPEDLAKMYGQVALAFLFAVSSHTRFLLAKILFYGIPIAIGASSKKGFEKAAESIGNMIKTTTGIKRAPH